MRLAYCTTCSPPKLLAVTTSDKSTPKGLMADKKPPKNMPSHFEDDKGDPRAKQFKDLATG